MTDRHCRNFLKKESECFVNVYQNAAGEFEYSVVTDILRIGQYAKIRKCGKHLVYRVRVKAHK